MTEMTEGSTDDREQLNREGETEQPAELADWIQGDSDQLNLEHIESEPETLTQGRQETPGTEPQLVSLSDALSERATDARPRRAEGSTEAAGPMTRLTIGSALIALDTLNERIEQAESEESGAAPPRRPEDVLVPMSEWNERFDLDRDRDPRYLMLGMMSDARSTTRRGILFVNRMSVSMANMIEAVLIPLSKSALFKPFTKRFNAAVDRGETQVKHWTDLGRNEDYRSRRLAQAAINQAADDTFDELIDNPRIHGFIQEVIQSQSQGMIEEGIEEVRERAISSDLFLERPIRRFLRKPPRDSVPPPTFDPRLVLPPMKRNVPLRRNSLSGYYAGFISRLISFGLDVVILSIILALGSWLISASINILGLDDFYTSLTETGSIIGVIVGILAATSGIIVVAGYFIGLWIFTGQTFGMMIAGLRVVSPDGGRLIFRRAFARFIGMIIAAIPLFLGYIWILFDNRRQGWQDKLGNTIIVYAWDAQPDETFLTDYLFRE